MAFLESYSQFCPSPFLD